MAELRPRTRDDALTPYPEGWFDWVRTRHPYPGGWRAGPTEKERIAWTRLIEHYRGYVPRFYRPAKIKRPGGRRRSEPFVTLIGRTPYANTAHLAERIIGRPIGHVAGCARQLRRGGAVLPRKEINGQLFYKLNAFEEAWRTRNTVRGRRRRSACQ